jgi:hypothetical protein
MSERVKHVSVFLKPEQVTDIPECCKEMFVTTQKTEQGPGRFDALPEVPGITGDQPSMF